MSRRLFPQSSVFYLPVVALALSGCLTTTGSSPTASTGAAGGSTAVGAPSNLERCDDPLGTLAVDDGREASWWSPFSRATQVTSIEPLLRLSIQQSNCFVLVASGNTRTSARMDRIRDKQRDSGNYRAGSNQHKGQQVAADYYMEPSIFLSGSPTGGVGASIGGRIGQTLGRVGSAVSSKSSVVTLSLHDLRSDVQLSISEGSSTSYDISAAFGAFGSSAAGGLSAFNRTPEGKATVAAFVDAYNKMVISLREYKAQDVKGGLGRGGVLKVN